MITNEIYFFKNQSSVSTSDYLYNVNDGTLILQVDGDVSNLELLVLGNTDLIDDDFVTLKTINASDYNMSDKITSTGIYWIDINGIRKIKLNLSKITGSVNVKAITKRGLTTDLVARAMAANSASGGDYYTKEETDNKLDNKQDKINRFYVVDCKNTLGDSFDEIMNIYDTDILNQLTNIMNECYTNGYKSIAILFSGKNSFIAYARHGSDFSKQRYNYYLYGYLNLEDTYDAARIYTRIVRTEINGAWNNNVFTTKGLFLNFGSSLIVPDTSQVLTKTNKTSYTPTNDYNPATKKYVDDAVASAGGGEPEMYVLEFSGNYNPSHQYNATDNDKIRVAELITTLKEDANVPIYVKFKNGYGLLFTPLYDIQPGQQPYYFYQCLKYNDSNLRVLYFCGLNIYGTWENDIFTVSTCLVSTDTNGFLSTGTQSSINDGFNPTLDQHPATKKYVDDTIASAITTSLEGSY